MGLWIALVRRLLESAGIVRMVWEVRCNRSIGREVHQGTEMSMRLVAMKIRKRKGRGRHQRAVLRRQRIGMMFLTISSRRGLLGVNRIEVLVEDVGKEISRVVRYADTFL